MDSSQVPLILSEIVTSLSAREDVRLPSSWRLHGAADPSHHLCAGRKKKKRHLKYRRMEQKGMRSKVRRLGWHGGNDGELIYVKVKFRVCRSMK